MPNAAPGGDESVKGLIHHLALWPGAFRTVAVRRLGQPLGGIGQPRVAGHDVPLEGAAGEARVVERGRLIGGDRRSRLKDGRERTS